MFRYIDEQLNPTKSADALFLGNQVKQSLERWAGIDYGRMDQDINILVASTAGVNAEDLNTAISHVLSFSLENPPSLTLPELPQLDPWRDWVRDAATPDILRDLVTRIATSSPDDLRNEAEQLELEAAANPDPSTWNVEARTRWVLLNIVLPWFMTKVLDAGFDATGHNLGELQQALIQIVAVLLARSARE